jgi:hypothetical protein
MSSFYLKTETDSSLRNSVFLNKWDSVLDENRTMDNVQKHNISNAVFLSSASPVNGYIQCFQKATEGGSLFL